ncbi:MAG: phosphodiester glycosidase family protein [Ruminococcus sp.]|nr:phosphodiester glycosidase family protein [Ruminococcus sp.]
MKENKKKKPFLFAVTYGAVLAAFTGYVMLDTFVIPKAENSDAGKMNLSLFEDMPSSSLSGDDSSSSNDAENRATDNNAGSEGSAKTSKRSRSKSSATQEQPTENSTGSSTVSSGNSTYQGYSDDNISVTVSEYNVNDTVVYVADVQLSSAQYLKTAFADDTYGRNVTAPTSDTAEANNAILAINGDYYGARQSGYVIRNGILYRDTGSSDTDVLCIYADGHFEITNSGEKSAQQLIDEGVWQAFSFGPALVREGEVAVTASQEVGKAMASNPRTAIGIVDDLHYLLVVSDGRTTESEGLSLRELAEFMQSLGVTTAYNLDGGGSSTMYYNGQVINNPTTSGRSIKERSVSDIVYIGY